MRKLLLVPSQSSYSARRGNSVRSIAFDGGPSRRRRDFVGATASVSVGWTLPPLETQYLDAFYRSVTEEGLLPFEIDLALDSWFPETFEARFVPGSYGITGYKGMATVYGAELEVVPARPDPDYDLAIVDLFELYGPEAFDLINELERLVNVHCANATRA